MVHLLFDPASRQQVDEMLEVFGTYLKLAVDIERQVAAGGGKLHADCESLLIEDGSRQEDVWGADWVPGTRDVRFEALINLRPAHGNPSVDILSHEVRREVERVVRHLLDQP